MVTVSNYAVRTTADGRVFIALELTGGLELIQSQVSGNFYATTRKCSMPSTFDEETAKSLIGSQLEGEIVKLDVEPYEFLNPRTGEVLLLNYTWAYQRSPSSVLVGATPVQSTEMA
ncbi:hypothetical protein [Mucilaginibacter panaciglaebae]|uniref:Uncharacterized protein n=1 Tax=Mucilaginibacter panaciglaebae TaxID=502331 RepID=A0ABP7WMY8_9SPHI